MKSFIFALPMILACASLTVWAAPPGKDIDVYHIGNSLTRGLSVRRLAALFDAAGGHYDHGTQLGGGKPLYAHLANRTADGRPFKRNNIQSVEYGDWLDAFREFTFDAIVLQPSGAWLRDRDPDNEIVTGDVEAASGLIAYATGNNPAGNMASQRFYIYAGWTRIKHMLDREDLDADRDGIVAFSEFWDAPYVEEGWVLRRVPNRDFFSRLVAELNQRHPDLAHPIRLVPVSGVLAALDAKIRAGQLPGLEGHLTRETKLIVEGEERPSNFDYYREGRRGRPGRRNPAAGPPLDANGDSYTGFMPSAGVYNIFADQVHMNAMPHNGDDDGTIGGYVGSLTFYVVFTGENPVGLTTRPWERIDPVADAELVEAVQQTVWEVVSTHALTGVSKPRGSADVKGE